MSSDDLHSLALQLSQAAQKYEQYWTEIENLAARYEGTPVWIRSILGETNPAFEELFADVTRSKELYVQSTHRVRNSLLKLSQALMRRRFDQ